MAERIIRQLIDDVDQSEIADGEGGAVEFAFRGTVYTIDLSDANAAALEQALAPFIAAATRVGGPRPRSQRPTTSTPRRGSRRTKAATPKHSSGEIRAWASEHGHEVSARGRIPASVVEAYEQAHTADRPKRPRR
jgi:Lsr2